MRCASILCCLMFASPGFSAPVPSPQLVQPKTIEPSQKKDGPAEQGDEVPSRGGKSPDAKESKESARIQKLKSVTYDRRPSAILKVWSKVPDDEKSEKADTSSKKAEKTDPFDAELAVLQRQVALGEWRAVKDFFAKLPADEAKAGFKHLLQALATDRPMQGGGMPGGMDPEMMMQMQQMHPVVMQYLEKNKFTADDVVGIAKATPVPLVKEQITSLGQIVRQAIAGGTVVEHIVGRFKSASVESKDTVAFTPRQAAAMLIAADQAAEAGVFLPPLERAIAERDSEALNMLALHLLALHAKEKKIARLEQAWSAIQAILTTPKADRGELAEALKRAVELAPKLREELGQAWLEQSFTKDPQRGMDILTTLGSTAAQAIQRQPRDQDGRFKTLQLQKTAVEALLRAAAEKTDAWRSSLTLLAGIWLKEAEFTSQFDRSTSFGPHMRRDRYGNFFYAADDDGDDQPMMMGQNPNMPAAITVADIMKAKPSDKWIEQIDDGMKPKLAMIFAKLFLKVNEEAKAYPFIEQLAATHAEKARELVNEFLKVWARNHNPNSAKDQLNPYMYYYGFERRAESIPLTRAKQERNLAELTEWVAKLQALKLGSFNDELLAKAFTSCHSDAEVYRMEAIEKVFGKVGDLKPSTLAALAQQMRENLGGLWRSPAEQKDKKTNRKLKDIQAEVLRGYNLAQSVVDTGVKKFSDSWDLVLAKAALQHDENNFRQQLAKSSDFSKNREQALAHFAKAAQNYAETVKDLREDEQSTKVYEQWLYASLGACDIGQISEDKIPDMRQPAKIRKALLSLPGEAAEKHMAKFANLLFTRLSAVNPAMKFVYLRAGFEIVGDHHLAHEARKVYDYYKDLVNEIKLEVALDGNDRVGHDQAFGVFVNLKHTREIERESGGFSKYLQNQNSGRNYYYNYGRPTTDYRDKFTSIVNERLKEQFEVLSVTFQTDKVNSRALPEYGWRYTPYAYLLLKAKGAQVDKIPPLRIDLDFLDTSGYVIIPIESATLPVDAAPAKGIDRPYSKLHVTQTLDERQADKGKLLLEVKATALGLLPDFDKVLTLPAGGFEVDKVADQGLSVARFDADSEANAIVSERIWLVTFKAPPGQSESPKSFAFGKANTDDAEMAYHRFKDADLVKVDSEISLEEQYGQASQAWIWWSIAGCAGAALAAGLCAWQISRRRPRADAGVNLPQNLSPFTVIGLLRHIDRNKKLTEAQQQELSQSLELLQRHYFADSGGNGEVDLKAMAEKWLRQAK
jgi:hypothetical protein